MRPGLPRHDRVVPRLPDRPADPARRFSLSLNGATLATLIEYAERIKLSGQALSLELSELPQLKTPCVLHWDLSHFVVLRSASAKEVVIHDPAMGVRHLSYAEVSKHFTGGALELAPMTTFQAADERRKVSLGAMIGKVSGWWQSVALVFAMSLALEVLALASPIMNQFVVDEALVSGDRALLNVLALGLLLMMVVHTLLAQARSWTIMYLSTHLNLQWISNVFGHLMRLPMAWFEKRQLGDVISRFGAVGVRSSRR